MSDTAPGSARPHLSDIAARAGVSKSLVSLALRGELGVGAQSRRQILEAARELGATPSAHAVRMVEGPKVIGAVVTDLGNPFHIDVVRGLQAAAAREDYHVLVADGARSVEQLSAQIATLEAVDVSALTLVSSWIDEEAVVAAGRRRPVVLVGTSVGTVAGTDTVRGDLGSGIRQTVEHLIALDHRRIAFIAESDRSSSKRRHAAYLETMNRFGFDDGCTSAHVQELHHNPQQLRELVLTRGYTALIAANDVTAIAVMDVAERAGLVIPDDVAIAGYDDTRSARIVRPRLTSVEQPWESMGARAFELIWERMRGRTVDRHEVTSPRLVVRGSTLGGEVAAPYRHRTFTA